MKTISWPPLFASLVTCALAMVLGHPPEIRIIAVASNQNFLVHYWASMSIPATNIEASEGGILSAIRSRTRV